jgi:Kef-type K+ transport system membrane component KefB
MRHLKYFFTGVVLFIAVIAFMVVIFLIMYVILQYIPDHIQNLNWSKIMGLLAIAILLILAYLAGKDFYQQKNQY